MLVSGKKWNKKEAQAGEATWQAHQPTTRESNGPGVMSFVVWPTVYLSINQTKLWVNYFK